jgi:hypothetical protein
MAWQGKAWNGMVRQGNAWHGTATHENSRHGKTWNGMARQGKVIHLDSFYYIFVIIFNPLGLDVLNFFFGMIDIWIWSS